MLARAPLLTPRPTPPWAKNARYAFVASRDYLFIFSFFFWRGGGGGGRVITIWNNKINNKNTEKLLHWTWDVRKLRGLLGTRIRMMVSASTHRFCILFAGCEKHTSSY